MEPVTQTLPRQRKSRQQIAALLQKHKSSGVKVSEFCDQHQLNKGTFHKWLSRSKQKPTSKDRQRPAFTKVRIAAPESQLFAEVNGIKIYQAVTASYLKELKG